MACHRPSGSQGVVPGPGAAASPGSLSECRFVGLTLDLRHRHLAWGPAVFEQARWAMLMQSLRSTAPCSSLIRPLLFFNILRLSCSGVGVQRNWPLWAPSPGARSPCILSPPAGTGRFPRLPWESEQVLCAFYCTTFHTLTGGGPEKPFCRPPSECEFCTLGPS